MQAGNFVQESLRKIEQGKERFDSKTSIKYLSFNAIYFTKFVDLIFMSYIYLTSSQDKERILQPSTQIASLLQALEISQNFSQTCKIVFQFSGVLKPKQPSIHSPEHSRSQSQALHDPKISRNHSPKLLRFGIFL
jgi:hypothetical protein